MSSASIFVNKAFTFSVSDLTVLQSWLLRKDNVIFFSDMILSMVSTLIYSSWVCVCVCVFAVHEWLSCSVWFGVFGFPAFIVSVTVVVVCWCVCLYICGWISSISRSRPHIDLGFDLSFFIGSILRLYETYGRLLFSWLTQVWPITFAVTIKVCPVDIFISFFLH